MKDSTALDFRNGTGLKAAMWAGAQMCPASHTKMVHGEGPKVRFEMPYLFLDRHGKLGPAGGPRHATVLHEQLHAGGLEEDLGALGLHGVADDERAEMLYYYTPDAKGLHQAVDFRNGTGLKAAMWAGAQRPNPLRRRKRSCPRPAPPACRP